MDLAGPAANLLGSSATARSWRAVSRAITAYAMAVTILAIIAVGISHIYLGVHYASDVVLGWAAGVIAIAVVNEFAGEQPEHVFRRPG